MSMDDRQALAAQAQRMRQQRHPTGAPPQPPSLLPSQRPPEAPQSGGSGNRAAMLLEQTEQGVRQLQPLLTLLESEEGEGPNPLDQLVETIAEIHAHVTTISRRFEHLAAMLKEADVRSQKRHEAVLKRLDALEVLAKRRSVAQRSSASPPQRGPSKR